MLRSSDTKATPTAISLRSGQVVAVAGTVVVVVVVLVGVCLASSAGAASSADRSAGVGKRPEPPSMRELARRAAEQQFTPAHLLGNDQIDVEGSKVVHKRIARAWETAKRVHLGKPQDPMRARELRAMYEQFERKRLEMRGEDEPNDAVIAGARMQMMQPGYLWPGETDRDRRIRLTATYATDRATSKDFWAEVDKANDEEPSDLVKGVCGAIALGPSVLGAISNALGGGANDKVREACENVGKRTEDTVEDVGDFVKDPVGTIAKGVFGPVIGELQKATVYTSKQVGAAIDKVATPDLSEQWLRDMLRRAATIAVLIALVAGTLGVAHAAITANLGALASVGARACISGIVGSAVLTLITVAVAFVDELTTIVTGSDPKASSKPFATLADTATKAMARAELPSFVTLILLLCLLFGLVVVWWEMWLRAPMLYAIAFFYGPAFSASLFPPARQVLSHLNTLLAAIVLMPLVIIALLQMAAESLAGQDTIAAVLQATGLILLAAASPGILIALLSPGVGLAAAAGIAGAFAGGRTVGRAGAKAASAGLGAASFARERMNATKSGGKPGDGSTGSSTGGGSGGGLGGPGSGPGRPGGSGDADGGLASAGGSSQAGGSSSRCAEGGAGAAAQASAPAGGGNDDPGSADGSALRSPNPATSAVPDPGSGSGAVTETGTAERSGSGPTGTAPAGGSATTGGLDPDRSGQRPDSSSAGPSPRPTSPGTTSSGANRTSRRVSSPAPRTQRPRPPAVPGRPGGPVGPTAHGGSGAGPPGRVPLRPPSGGGLARPDSA